VIGDAASAHEEEKQGKLGDGTAQETIENQAICAYVSQHDILM
jgi:hypothetical protein